MGVVVRDRRRGPMMPQVTIARRDGSCSSWVGPARRGDRWEQRGGYKKCRVCFMAAAHVLVLAVCGLRVALATVYFQEEFLDGGEGVMPVVRGCCKLLGSPLLKGCHESPSALARRSEMG